MADSSEVLQSPPFSPEVIDSLLTDTQPALLLAWLDLQPQGREILRGFQQNTKSLRLPPVRARFKDVLTKYPDVTESLIEAWKVVNGKLLAEVHSLSDKKLLAKLPQLKEEHGEKTTHLTLILDGREKILGQQSSQSISKKLTKKTASKLNAAEKIANLQETVLALQAEAEVQHQALEISEEKLRQAQQAFKQEVNCFHERQRQSLSNERELKRDLKREIARAAKADQLLEEMSRVSDRNERRLKKLQHEQEETDLEIKRLRRQVRHQQKIAEDLRKQLAGLQPPISERTKVLSAPADIKTVKEKTDLKHKTLLNPADQQFLFEVAGNHFQISARQLSQAVECNDEDLVFSLTQALFTLREINPAGHKMFLERVRAFDRYSARILTGDTTRVLVDASNVVRFEKNKYGKGILENLLTLRDELRSRSYFPIILIADASLPYFIDQPLEFKKLVHEGVIQVTNKGEEADEYLTRLAQQTGAFVVTNDVNFHLKTAPSFDPLRIGFTIDHGAVYLHEF